MKKEKRRSKSKLVGGSQLAVINPRVAGIDIGSREMFVCGPANLEGHREIRAFFEQALRREPNDPTLKANLARLNAQ